jgi:hypothetical protein
MDDQRCPLAESHYPQVPNNLVNDPTPKDQAIYVPSVSPGYATDVSAQNWARPLPKGVGSGDLNFLDPQNKLFRISHAMTSAGQALNQKKPCIISERDRKSTLIIGDSGGYQIASNKMRIDGDRDRLKILRWLENTADVAMTLDVPTGPVLKAGYRFQNAQDCLTATLEHLDFFQRHRKSPGTRFLNVLQGNTVSEANAWYDSVKHYEFDGWAFAGVLRHNIEYFCARIIKMADENQLQNKSWIHVLGTCELETAVLLTALQRAINANINPNLRISYDTSSPFRILSFGRLYTLPKFEAKRMVMGGGEAPDASAFIGSQLRWPWPSPLGDYMRLGDFCVDRPVTARTTHDMQSNHYLAHHNLAALCFGIALANRIFDSESVCHRHTVGLPVGAAVEAINSVFKAGTMSEVRKYQRTFSHLRHGIAPDSGDDERAC